MVKHVEPNIQPFKQITVIMHEATNLGVTEFHGNPIESLRLKDDHTFAPIGIDLKGEGQLYSGAVAANTAIPIGILMESHKNAEAQHSVMVHGIAPIRATGTITAGKPVVPNGMGCKNATTQTTHADKEYILGIALTSAVDGEFANILIGTTGGKF